jgi:rod shape-determining protein MreC
MGRRRIIALLVLSSLLLITLDIRGNAGIDKARSAFALLMRPFDTAARAVSRPIVDAWRGIDDYERLQKENEALRAQVDAQRGASIEAQASLLEYQELLVINRLTSASSFPTVTAQVEGQAPSNFSATVEINKGANDGIRVGMPVVNGAGLVGKITSVTSSASIVLLISDPGFSIGVKVLTAVDPANPGKPVFIQPGGGIFSNESTTTSSSTTSTSTSTTSTTTTTVSGTFIPGINATTSLPADTGSSLPGDSVPSTDLGTAAETSTSSTTTTLLDVVRETGTLSGQGPGKPLIVRFVSASSTTGALLPGSTVQTAGGNRSIAPAGLPVGTIASVRPQSGSSVPLVEVESAAGDLTNLNFLTVLLYLPTSG